MRTRPPETGPPRPGDVSTVTSCAHAQNRIRSAPRRLDTPRIEGLRQLTCESLGLVHVEKALSAEVWFCAPSVGVASF
jgi:hypothetical protein